MMFTYMKINVYRFVFGILKSALYDNMIAYIDYSHQSLEWVCSIF